MLYLKNVGLRNVGPTFTVNVEKIVVRKMLATFLKILIQHLSKMLEKYWFRKC
jgi:hypothetical protein